MTIRFSPGASTDSTSASDALQSILQEQRHFAPPAEFSAKAHVKSSDQYQAMYRQSIDNPEKFWGEHAASLHWFKKWDRVLEWNLPDAQWFVGGKTNLCYNCVDRQVQDGLGDKTAIVWEGEPIAEGKGPEVRKLTYKDLQRETSRFANVLKSKGVKKGDRVTIYMPMVPELAIAVLACARIGAPHSVIFGGFSANAIKDRVEDAQSTVLITADAGWRRGKPVPLKDTVDEALSLTNVVKTVIVYQRCNVPVKMTPGRDHWWHDL
ncbi:MAG: AMP-binding protein, partial [Phycisphaeraceae bacterium]|nr:AMP-binding protein [Phycisphaeraceae bacterium]